MLVNIVAVVKVKTLEQKLVNGKAKALVDLLANALAEILMQSLGYTLAEVQAKVLMDKLTDRIAREVETFYNTVGEVEGNLMANKVAPSIAVLRVKALGHKLTEVWAAAKVDTLVERPAHLQMKTLGLDSC